MEAKAGMVDNDDFPIWAKNRVEVRRPLHVPRALPGHPSPATSGPPLTNPFATFTGQAVPWTSIWSDSTWGA